MSDIGSAVTPGAIGRFAFGAATLAAAVLGFAVDARWFAASGAFGGIWWAWDLLGQNVIGPAGRLFTAAITGTSDVEDAPDLTVDDTIRLLEDHLSADGVPRHVQIQSALRLAEIYRLNRKDEAKAAEVIARVKAKWPDAPEWALFERERDAAK